MLTVDAWIQRDDGALLLIQRKNPPFQGCWALPGGFVDIGESCEEACVREVEEETGLRVRIVRLLTVLSDPDRDPRGHVVSVVFECSVTGGYLTAGDDAAHAEWIENPGAVELAFDHALVVTGSPVSPH